MATPISAAPVKDRSLVMGGNVRTTTLRFHPRPKLSRKERLAADLHRSPAWIEKAIYGWLNQTYVAVIESDMRAGDYESVALWTAPALAAEMGEDIPDLTEAWQEYDAADCAEDAGEAKLNRRDPTDMTDDELEEYGRLVAKETFAAARYLASLRREQKRRKA